MDDVFNAPEIYVSTIVREFEIVGARAILVKIIQEVVNSFNVGKTMNDIQIAETVDDIIELYPYFKLEDFRMSFKRAKMGKYGELYDRLDESIILKWLKMYDQERMEVAIYDSKNKQKEDISVNATTYEAYLEYLKSQADAGDEKAMQILVEKSNGDLLKTPEYLAYKARRNKQFYKK